MASCYCPWALYCCLLQHCNQWAPMAPLLQSLVMWHASRCLSRFQAYRCSHIKRNCDPIKAWKEESHGLELNKSNLGKNKPRCAWPSQFTVQAHGLEQEPISGTQPIHNQASTKFENRTFSLSFMCASCEYTDILPPNNSINRNCTLCIYMYIYF